MIELSFRQAFDICSTLQGFKDQQIKGAAAFALVKFMRNVEVEWNKIITILQEKYAEKNEDGTVKYENGCVIIPADKTAECQKETDELFNMKVSFEIGNLTEDIFYEVNLTTAQAMALQELIK